MKAPLVLPQAALQLQHSGDMPIALVIGMSIQGLAVARALAAGGVPVHALEQHATTPAVRTRFAKVHCVPGINSDALVKVLLEFRTQLPANRKAVLFPGSDNMVRAIATGWEQLAAHYELSWHGCRDLVLYLQNKDHLDALCEEKRVAYPKSVLLRDERDVDACLERLRFPWLVKPIKPLSSFKAIRMTSVAELQQLIALYQGDLPFVVQEWIDGDETRLHFCTMYMRDGEVLCHFTGRKVRSRPRGLGMGTVVESFDNPEVLALSREFVAGMPLSGPIAIEFKQDDSGKYWMIEPNVGRTEYSVDLLIQNGINLPLIEYWTTLGFEVGIPEQRRPVMWFDTERDLSAYPALCAASGSLEPHGRHPVFPYFGHGDLAPMVASWQLRFTRPAQAIVGRLKRLIDVSVQTEIRSFGRIAELPADAVEFLRGLEQESLFFGHDWFENYEREVAVHEGTPEWHCVYSPERELLAVWPFVRIVGPRGTMLKGMGNYYTPYITLPYRVHDDRQLTMLRSALSRIVRTADHVELTGVAPNDPLHRLISRSHGPLSAVSARRYFTTNWFDAVADLDRFWSSRDPQLLNTIRRKSRKLEREHGHRFVVQEGEDGLDTAIADYFEVYAQSWKNREPYPEFIVQLIRLASRKGMLRLGLLYVDGRPAAAQLWFVQRRTAYMYKLAYDEVFAPKSAGTLLTAHLIDHVVANDGVYKLDYLTGDDAYKRAWMHHSRQLDTVILMDLKRLGAWPIFIRKTLSLLRTRLPGQSAAATS